MFSGRNVSEACECVFISKASSLPDVKQWMNRNSDKG